MKDNIDRQKIIIVAGPTASGKTELAVKLAKKYNGELINADSRQIYKYLDIGTNKGAVAPMRNEELGMRNNKEIEKSRSREIENLPTYYIDNKPIYLLSFLDPNERFDVFSYKELCEKYIANIAKRQKLPILVGGTGLYIDSVIKGYSPQIEKEKKREIGKFEGLNLQELQQELLTHNPELYNSLNNSDQNNKRRLIRLLLKTPNQKITASPQLGNIIDRKYDTLMLYKDYEYQDLISKIEKRVEKMFEEGIVEETERVLTLGFPEDSIALQGIGYKQVLMFLHDQISLEECKELIKIAHRQYAKRQRTWFESGGRGYDLKKVSYIEDAEEYIDNFLDYPSLPSLSKKGRRKPSFFKGGAGVD